VRVRFLGRVPDPEQMYFRGPGLGHFDGREWTRGVSGFAPSQRLRSDVQVFGAPVEYEITLEPSRLALLPLLEMTPDRADAAPEIEGYQASLRNDAQWQLDRPASERLRTHVKAWTSYRHGPRNDQLALRDLVELPPGFNPRSLQWALSLRNRPENLQAEPRRLADLLLAHVRAQDYSYTLEPGSYGRNAIDEFWFDRRLGFCEHFAAAFVVMMRAMDVPARIVTGYQGSDPVPVDGYYVVRQSHAHAWAEYWQPGQGWLRADPTAAVAPERVRISRNLQPASGFVANALSSVNPQFALQMRQTWEAMNNRWNQWVLNYARGDQVALLKKLGFESPDWTDLSYVLIGLLCSGSLAAAAWALWDRHRQDPWQRLQRRVATALQTLGVTVAAHDLPRTGRPRAAVPGARGGDLAARLDARAGPARYARGSGRLPLRRWWRDFARAAAAAAAH
jgi:hypothetical protein